MTFLRRHTPDVLEWTDFFCGYGGSSTGIERAARNMRAPGVEVRQALNHWEQALRNHERRHPTARHYLTDISRADPRGIRRTRCAWFSPECTSHSPAGGNKRSGATDAQLGLFDAPNYDPAAERSRATAWDVVRFSEYHEYDLIFVENVIEFRQWKLFPSWYNTMLALGYEGRAIYLNSMHAQPSPDSWAPQSRDRMYLCFWKKHLAAPDLDIRPRAYCASCARDVDSVQSWKNGRVYGKYREQYVYRCPSCATEVEPYYWAAINVVDFSEPIFKVKARGTSAMPRTKPLVPNTRARIRAGLRKFGNTWIAIDSNGNKIREMTAPLFTQTTAQTVGLVAPFQVTARTHMDARSVTEAWPTMTTGNNHGLAFFGQYYGGRQAVSDGSDPLPTVTTEPRHALIVPPSYLVDVRGDAFYTNARSLTDALSTVTAGGINQAIALPFSTPYYGNGTPSSMLDALDTVVTKPRHTLVMPPSIPDDISDEELEHLVDECYYRMLRAREVGRAQGFEFDPDIEGTEEQQVKMFGNAVSPPAAELLVERGMAILMS
jgi:DNA (cytosine-5)-methyltransferase 1